MTLDINRSMKHKNTVFGVQFYAPGVGTVSHNLVTPLDRLIDVGTLSEYCFPDRKARFF